MIPTKHVSIMYKQFYYEQCIISNGTSGHKSTFPGEYKSSYAFKTTIIIKHL